MFASPLDLLKKHVAMILLTGAIMALLIFLLTILMPRDYRADAQVLIISKTRYGVDPYTTVKSAERVGENIVQVVKTNDFYQKVTTNAGYQLDTTRFTNVSERTKRKRWNNTVDASVVYGTGVLNVSAYHRNPEQAVQFAAAAAQTLVEKGWEYVGGDVIMKVVNDPIVTRWPVRPNVLVNTLAGFFVGIVIAGVWALHQRRHLLS